MCFKKSNGMTEEQEKRLAELERLMDGVIDSLRQTTIDIHAIEGDIEQLKNAVFPSEPPAEEPDTYKWVIDKYGGIPIPYDTLYNPHGLTLAKWRTLDDATVFFPVKPIIEKPNFEINSGVKLSAGAEFFGYRKVLSGMECNSQPHVMVCDPAGGAVPKRKCELVGIILEGGTLEKVGGDERD